MTRPNAENGKQDALSAAEVSKTPSRQVTSSPLLNILQLILTHLFGLALQSSSIYVRNTSLHFIDPPPHSALVCALLGTDIASLHNGCRHEQCPAGAVELLCHALQHVIEKLDVFFTLCHLHV